MSKKVSAFQVYSEDRQSRSYRNSSSRSQSNKYESPPRRSGRKMSSDWREDVKMDIRVHSRQSSSPEMRRDRSYEYSKYDSRREDTSLYVVRDSRLSGDVHQSTQSHFPSDDHFDQNWNRGDRHDDYISGRNRADIINTDDYLIVDTQRDRTPKGNRKAQYSDSDEECLHESLRRKKQAVGHFADDHDPRRWSTDEDEYSSYALTRKRALSSSNYHSPSPPPAKQWRETRRYSSDDNHQNVRPYDTDDDVLNRGHGNSTATKKKKIRGSFKMGKGKDKKRKANVAKIQSLMDVKIPSSVKKQVEQSSAGASSTNVSSLPRFGESRSEFKFGHRNSENSRSMPRNHDSGRNSSRYEYSSGSRSHYDDDRYSDHQRDLPYGHRDSDFDKKGHHYSSHRSPDYDRRARVYQHSDDDYGRDRPRNRRNSTDVFGMKRKRQNSVDRHDWQRGGNRNAQRDRSPEYREYSDSDQDSDHGGRRSWRDERRQPKKKEEDRDKSQKGDKKSKVDSKNNKDAKKSDAATTSSATKKKKQADSEGRMQAVLCKDGIAVLMTHPQQICIRGRATVQVLAGEMSVMGYTMNAEGGKLYNLFSPTTSSLLTITTCSAEKEKKTLLNVVENLGIDEKLIKDYMNGAVIFLATKLDCPAADYICTHPPFTQLFRFSFDRVSNPPSSQPNSELAKVGAAFLPLEQAASQFLKTSDEFDNTLKKWTEAVKCSESSPVVVLCGGANSGKSTLSRFMVNSTLSSLPRVCYMDCDIGQTEFSPPGSVSLTMVEQPVFGPPFCHQKNSEKMCFYGFTNPRENATRYTQCVQYVWKSYLEMDPKPPLIVNTMGWNEDVGLRLFVDILHLTTPDFVIQLNVNNSAVDFPTITPQFPVFESGWLYNTEPVEQEGESGSNRKEHKLVALQSQVSSRFDQTRVKLTSKNMRDLALLSHLMQGFVPTITTASSFSHTVPWNMYAILSIGQLISLELLIGSLHSSVVALCKADLSEASRTSDDMPFVFEKPPICDCLGYGLIRQVDMEKQLLHILTPLSSDCLSQVNTLMRGSVTVPDQWLLKLNELEIPFIDALEPTTASGPLRRRNHMPRRLLPSTTRT